MFSHDMVCKLWSLHRIYSQVWCWWIISVSVWGDLLLFIIDPFLFLGGLWSERLSSWSTLSVSLCGWLRCLLFMGKSKMKWNFLPSQACCSLNRRLLTCGISCVSWVLDNMMSESSCGLGDDRNSEYCRFAIMVCLKSWAKYYILIYYTHQR
jgi:hypothetical protein